MSSKLLLALAGLAAAKTTTIAIFAPMLEGDLEASVMSVDGSTTTLGVRCPKGSTSDNCGLPGTDFFTLVNSPETLSYHYENKQLSL